MPDECTIIDFKGEFYTEFLKLNYNSDFFSDNDLHSTLIFSNTDTDYLHNSVFKIIQKNLPAKLLIDNLVMEITNKVLDSIPIYQPNVKVDNRLKKNHLLTIERAKKYISDNFKKDISLSEIANYCYVSPFHFSRIFKTFTSFSPYRYLLYTRLKNAELLIRNTKLPVTDIAFSSGFNGLEHFISTFRQRYKYSPHKYRNTKKEEALVLGKPFVFKHF